MSIIINQGISMFLRNIKVRFNGFKRYRGSVKTISKSIINGCWNGKYFNVSSGHFKVFYIRDFAWVFEPLIKKGFKEKAIKTLNYVTNKYIQSKRVSVALYNNRLYDFPSYAVDSFPYLVMLHRKAKELLDINPSEDVKRFFKDYAEAYKKKVIDNRTGLVREDKFFSSIKDHHLRRSSCYDNVMVAMLSKDLNFLNISNSLPRDQKKKIKKKFWNGKYFKDGMDDNSFSSDSNIFPFWTGLYDISVKENKRMLMSVLEYITERKLNSPFPLKYHYNGFRPKRLIKESFFAKDYETDSIWMHIGLIYIDILSKVNREAAKMYLISYKTLIDVHKTFLEVYDKKGKPYKSLFYYTDEGMIWIAYFLELYERLLG
jgi:hypothetical protein